MTSPKGEGWWQVLAGQRFYLGLEEPPEPKGTLFYQAHKIRIPRKDVPRISPAFEAGQSTVQE